MTNREYMASLDDEELASYLYKEPWEDSVRYMVWFDGFGSHEEALADWLNKYHEEE